MSQEENRRICELLKGLTTGEGIRPSQLKGVSLIRANCSCSAVPVMYEPGIVILVSGRKRAHLGGQVFTYDAQNYLVATAPMPFSCETEVSAGPLLGLSVAIDVEALSELMMKMELRPRAVESGRPGLAVAPLGPAMEACTLRLLQAMADPSDARVLGPMVVREILYRVLCGPLGDHLRGLLALHGTAAQIHRALQRIHAGYAERIEVARLASEAGMSVSAFHHRFKEVTASSPLQYLKSVRLHRARLLLAQGGVSASAAASQVGYESPSQFSREFKRFFGAPPLEEAERVRSMLVAAPVSGGVAAS